MFVKARRRRGDGVAGEQHEPCGACLRRRSQTTSRSTRSARIVMSSRLPIGVATTNSVPGMWGGNDAFIVPLADRMACRLARAVDGC